MEGLKRLFAQSKRFYLCLFLLVCVCILYDCLINFVDYRMVDSVKVTQQKEYLDNPEPETLFQNTYISCAGEMLNRVTEWERIVLYGVVLVEILFLLAGTQLVFADERMKEFQSTWPVKNWIRELYHYVSILGVLLSGIFLQLLILLGIQNRYNYMLMDVVGADRQNDLVSGLLKTSNQELVRVMLYYMLVVAVLYSWIYLGMCIAKKPVIGVIGSLTIWNGIVYVCEEWNWYFASRDVVHYMVDGELGYKLQLYLHKFRMIIACLLSNDVAKTCYQPDKRCFQMWCFDSEESIYSVSTWIFLKILLWVLFVLAIVLVAWKKDLAKGRVFYFSGLNVVFSLFAGIVGGTVWARQLVLRGVKDIAGYDCVSIIFMGVVTMLVTLLVLQPRSVKKKNCLEVK